MLNPALEPIMADPPDPGAFAPPVADYWYDLHDVMS